MKTSTLFTMLLNLLDAKQLDLEFLIDTIEKHNLDFNDICEMVEATYWHPKADINVYIYEALEQLAQKFIKTHENLFKTEDDKEYTIFTNYLDSHIWFNSQEIQSEFEEKGF